MVTKRVPGSGPTAEISYEDEGAGAAVVLVHGREVAGAVWPQLIHALLEEGHRVITYHCGDAGAVTNVLNELVTALDLRQAALVAHETGARDALDYLSRYGSERVRRAVFVAFDASANTRAEIGSIDVPVLIAEINDCTAAILEFIDG